MSKRNFLDFEQPIAELENKIEELRYVQTESAVDISAEIEQLSKKSLQLTNAHTRVLKAADGTQAIEMTLRKHPLSGSCPPHLREQAGRLIITNGRYGQLKPLRQLPNTVFLHFFTSRPKIMYKTSCPQAYLMCYIV